MHPRNKGKIDQRPPQTDDEGKGNQPKDKVSSMETTTSELLLVIPHELKPLEILVLLRKSLPESNRVVIAPRSKLPQHLIHELPGLRKRTEVPNLISPVLEEIRVRNTRVESRDDETTDAPLNSGARLYGRILDFGEVDAPNFALDRGHQTKNARDQTIRINLINTPMALVADPKVLLQRANMDDRVGHKIDLGQDVAHAGGREDFKRVIGRANPGPLVEVDVLRGDPHEVEESVAQADTELVGDEADFRGPVTGVGHREDGEALGVRAHYFAGELQVLVLGLICGGGGDGGLLDGWNVLCDTWEVYDRRDTGINSKRFGGGFQGHFGSCADG